MYNLLGMGSCLVPPSPKLIFDIYLPFKNGQDNYYPFQGGLLSN